MKAEGSYRGKRQLDFTLALIALIVLFPLMAIISWGVFVSSGSPIIFRRKVVGLAGRPIIIYKFRTMLVGADSQQIEIYKQNGYARPKNDPRITRFGSFLRRASLDELPQLLNILRGEMSLVGPRPWPSWQYDFILPEYKKLRLTMLPGLSGPVQINLRFFRLTNLAQCKKLEEDYSNNCSFVVDLKIILKTIKLIFSPNNAY